MEERKILKKKKENANTRGYSEKVRKLKKEKAKRYKSKEN